MMNNINVTILKTLLISPCGIRKTSYINVFEVGVFVDRVLTYLCGRCGCSLFGIPGGERKSRHQRERQALLCIWNKRKQDDILSGDETKTCTASLWNCDQSRLKRYYDKSTLQKEVFFFFFYISNPEKTHKITPLYPLYYCLDPVTQYLYNKKYVCCITYSATEAKDKVQWQ